MGLFSSRYKRQECCGECLQNAEGAWDGFSYGEGWKRYGFGYGFPFGDLRGFLDLGCLLDKRGSSKSGRGMGGRTVYALPSCCTLIGTARACPGRPERIMQNIG